MTFGTATSVQLAFGLVCAVTGTFGTWLQVAGQRFAQRGGPREAPVLARLAGAGSPWDQLIFINDRGAVAAFGAMLGNAGSAMLMASVIAGLVINFPGVWPAGFALYLVVLIFGAGRIVLIGTIDLWKTRIIQEDMFEKLPPDSDIVGYGGAGTPMRTTSYRSDILAKKPDLGRSILRNTPITRPFTLYAFVRASFKRESDHQREEFSKALVAAKSRG